MISLQSAENALKSFYLDAVKETLDLQTSPLLAKIERSSENVCGKDVKKLVRIGVHNGFAAGTETGDLPKADQSNYVQLTGTLKNLYGTIEISDKAIRASQSNEGAFVNILNSEMENLLRAAKYQVGRMVMGNGIGFLTDFHATNEPHTLTVSNTAPLQVGMRVLLYDEDMSQLEDDYRVIEKISRDTKKIVISGSGIGDTELIGCLCAQCADQELTGVRSLFDNSELYGLTADVYDKIRPISIESPGEIDENMMQTAIDQLEEVSGSAPDLIVCSWGVRRALLKYFKENGVRMDSMEIEGGFKALSFNGIPVVADRFCPPKSMYFFNTNDIKMYQLGDWQWLEDDNGRILHQVPGKPVYTATLVKYAELMFERPNSIARITDIDEV